MTAFNDWDEEPAELAPMLVIKAPATEEKPTAGDERWDDAKPVPIQRVPVSLNGTADPESYVIGCCILDEGATLDKAMAAKLWKNDFKNQRLGEIYHTLCELRWANEPIDLQNLYEWFGSDHIEITELMALADPLVIGTTTRATHYIDRILQESANRKEVKRAMEILDRAKRGENVGAVDTTRTATDQTLRLLESSRFNGAFLIPKPTPIFTAADTTICTPGNLTALYSQAKAGKTATIGGMLAATMQLPGAVNDTLGFQGCNATGKAVIHFDTEQSRYDWQQMILTAARRAKLSTPPNWLKSHILTGMNVAECRNLLEAAMVKYSQEHGGIYALFLDGVGDLVTDVNEPKECNEFVAYLHGLAIKYDCAIILILHLNPTSDAKGRGHLGSQLQRKVESNLMLEKTEDGTTRLYATQQRGKMITKDKALCFRWSDEAQMHVSVQSSVPISLKGGRPKKYMLSMFSDFMPRTKADAKTFSVLLKYATSKKGIKETAFRALLDESVETGEVFQILAPGGYLFYLNVPGSA